MKGFHAPLPGGIGVDVGATARAVGTRGGNEQPERVQRPIQRCLLSYAARRRPPRHAEWSAVSTHLHALMYLHMHVESNKIVKDLQTIGNLRKFAINTCI
jgi:hypothetical protein